MIEYVVEILYVKMLFLIYYYELIILDQVLLSLKNVYVVVNEYKGEFIFLYKVKDGVVDDSYGI